jgi:subtilisin-like proprotein convertase family protein
MNLLAFLSRVVKQREKKNGTPRRQLRRARRSRGTCPALEVLEDRRLLSGVLPVPQVSNQQILTGSQKSTSASVSIDPINPNKMVAVSAMNFTPTGSPPFGEIDAQFSTDGGKTWTNLGTAIFSLPDPATTMPTVPYAQASDAGVGFDLAENFYVFGSEHNAGNSSGSLILSKFAFASSSARPSAVFTNKEVYTWTKDDWAYNPILAVDTNQADFKDTDTNRHQIDPQSGSLVIAWNSNTTQPATTGTPPPFNPSQIFMILSSDGGLGFTPVQRVNDDGSANSGLSFPSERDAQPQVSFVQGSSSGSITGGKLVVTWNDFFVPTGQNPPTDRITAAVYDPAGKIVSGQFTGTGGTIRDAMSGGTGNPDIPVSTIFDLPVNITDMNFGSLSDLTATLNIIAPNLDQLDFTLYAPDPTDPNNNAIKPTDPHITLINNQTDESGMTRMGLGITGANLGIQNGFNIGTTLDSVAARSIRDTGASAPFIGHYRPENSLLNWIAANGFTRSTINGVWKLVVTDHRNSGTPPPVQSVVNWTLNYSSRLTTSGFGGTAIESGLVNANVIGAQNGVYPFKLPVSPNAGIGPAPTVAVDNTLGSFSPFSGRIYLAYVNRKLDIRGNPTNDTDVILIASDNGGASWNALTPSVDPITGIILPGKVVNDDSPTDGFSEGSRQQFQPLLAVDPVTGTLVVSFLDDRWDPAQARYTTTIAASLDGGQDFGPETFANFTSQSVDAITGNVVTVAPIPDNANLMDATGFGSHQGLAVYGGHVVPVWTANLNDQTLTTPPQNLEELETADVRIAAGPRVISSDMGPVVNAFTVIDDQGKSVTYNNSFAADGSRELDAFLVTFDRPVDVNSFTPDQVKVIYRSPTTPAGSPGVSIAVGMITPLDEHTTNWNPTGANPVGGIQGGNPTIASRFLVRLLNPQSAIGTYSYAIGPSIRDRIRSFQQTVAPSGAPATFTSFDTPLAIVSGGIGSTTTSSIPVFGLPGVIDTVKVAVSITYPSVQDLRLTLIAPDGTRVPLVRENTTSGANYGSASPLNYTTFDDAASRAITSGSAPYIGTFQPETPLAALLGHGPNSFIDPTTGLEHDWTLEVVDTFLGTGVTGTLNSWTLTIQPGTASESQQSGNYMDQNANGFTREANVDAYAAPTPVNGFPFTLPYAPNTLPLIVPGPHVVVTNPAGQPQTLDNLILNAAQSSIDITFDRDMNPATITPASILRMVGGPTGIVSGPFTVTELNARTYRIGFPTQQIGGSYSIVLASTIKSAAGDLMDANFNAGLDVLRGGNPVVGSTAIDTINSGPLSTSIGPLRTVSVPLTVSDSFIIQGATLQLNILSTFDPDLSAVLIAPDGTTVKLFSNVGGGFPNPQNFSNTVFDDAATTPIQLGTPPYSASSFNPQTPLSALIGHGSAGTWQLVITNRSHSNSSTLTNWILNLKENIPGTGLGEPVADQTTVSFRIFTQDPTNALSHDTWTAIGPEGNNQPFNTNRISDIVVDPSDLSGNTVYVTAGDGGGVWKTTNFLTTNPLGPTYIPLLDFSLNDGLKAKSIAVFPRNNDPNQTVLFVTTGDGVANTPGIGILRSMDGGASWQILDSHVNFDSGGNVLPLDSPLRDHALRGLTSFKILVDPRARVDGNLVLYAAFGGTGANSGIWKSSDTGKTWTQVQAGDATDIVFVQDSVGTDGNLQRLYSAIRGTGVFLSANAGGSWDLLTGGVGNKLFITTDTGTVQFVPLTAPATTPNGIAGAPIALATPDLTGNPLQDFLYQNWLYVEVNGNLYVTKDHGQNWTQVALNYLFPPNQFAADFPSNDNNKPSYNPTNTNTLNPQYPFPSMSVDATNPNIVYLGGAHLLRLDLTRLSDPYAFVAYNDNLNDGGLARINTTGAVSLRPAPLNSSPYFFFSLVTGLPETSPITTIPPGSTPFYNLLRDPNNPFITPTTLLTTNVTAFNNQGLGVRWSFIDGAAGYPIGLPQAQEGPPTFGNPVGYNQFGEGNFSITTYRDPLTGLTRLLMGTNYGPFTAVINPDGTFLDNISVTSMATGSRTGNLQISSFNGIAIQPSTLAAQIQGGLVYGTTSLRGLAHSDPNVLDTGNLTYSYDPGSVTSTGAAATTYTGSTGVATDQTGSGTVYAYKWPNAIDFGFGTDFLQVQLAGASNWISRTSGLIQAGDNPLTGAGQWPFNVGSNVVVNPIDNKGMLVSSQAGNIFRSLDQGLNWFVISGSTNVLDSRYANALAFGAPDPSAVGNLDNFIFVGTNGGHIYFTLDGGGHWVNVSGGLDGSAVQQIVTNPRRGSHEAYAVTANGVYHMADVTAAGATWTNITGNLFQLTHNIFGTTQKEAIARSLTAIVADWRVSIADNAVTEPRGPFHPALYVGGDSGVFRSLDNGKTWTVFPNFVNDGAPQDGGYLPMVRITGLALSQGNINPATGLPDQTTGFDLLVASTAGRGMWAIRLTSDLVPGPTVMSLVPTSPATVPISSVDVTFSGPVDPQTFTVADVTILAPDGTVIPAASVVDITPTPPAGQGSIHNKYRIFFAGQSAPGIYKVILGPNISDFSGDRMNQNLNGVNGENPSDTYTGYFTIPSPPGTTATSGTPIIYGQNQATGQWSASLSNGVSALTNVPFWDLWPTTAHWVDVQIGDFNGDGLSDYVGRLAETGQWWVSLSNGSGTYSTSIWGGWAAAAGVTWVDVRVTDLNGDGKSDIVGRWKETGQWWVALNTGAGFVNQLWGTWDPTVTWVNVQTADFNGDGKFDLAGRNLATGQWYVGISTGSTFNTTVWTTWSTRVTWLDVIAGDFTGTGKAAIVGRTLEGGQWWAAVSNGTSFTNQLWATWSTGVTWIDVRAGDFNGDGKLDIVGLDQQNGQLWANISTGTGFNVQLWGAVPVGVTWANVLVGDFDGNGKADLAFRNAASGQWVVALSTGASFSDAIFGTWDPTVTWVDVNSGNFNSDNFADVIGRNANTGQWFVGLSTGGSFNTVSFGYWYSPTITWVDVHTGDFTGTGKSSIVGRVLQTGQWVVSVDNGNRGFTTSVWDSWAPSVTWADVVVGDFNGDGKLDIAGRWLQTGQWWVAVSNGTSFTNQLWTTWAPSVTWTDVVVGDFNGDGKADIAGRWLQTGQWWVAVSNGTSFNNLLWATWDPSVTWVDVRVGDLTGSGKADIIGRNQATGQWNALISNGAAFTNSIWATWSPFATWVDVQLVDLNGDGKLDLVARYKEGGQWWAGISDGTKFNTVQWGVWDNTVNWVDVHAVDLNGDGKGDIIGRNQATGQWNALISNGASFTNSIWGVWDPTVVWVNVLVGNKA